MTPELKSLIDPIIEADSRQDPRFTGWFFRENSLVHLLLFQPTKHQEELKNYEKSIKGYLENAGSPNGGLYASAVVPNNASERVKEEELKIAREKLYQEIDKMLGYAP